MNIKWDVLLAKMITSHLITQAVLQMCKEVNKAACEQCITWRYVYLRKVQSSLDSWKK